MDGTFTRPTKGRVLLDKKPIASVSHAPNENVIFLGPFGPEAGIFWNLPPETFMVYVHATEKGRDVHRKRIAAGDYLFFKMGTGLFDRSGGPIHEIWRRAPKDVIAIARVAAGEEGDWKNIIYVDMMTVREPWRRAGVNTLLMKTLQRRFPGRRLAFSQPTYEGSDFIRAAHERGMEIELPKTLKKTKIEGHMNDLGITLRTSEMQLDRIQRDVREGNCDWARFQLDVMKQKAVNDPSYAALLPQAEQAASSCTNTALADIANEDDEDEIDESKVDKVDWVPLASVAEECGDLPWVTCKRKLDSPKESNYAPIKTAVSKGAALVTTQLESKEPLLAVAKGTRACKLPTKMGVEIAKAFDTEGKPTPLLQSLFEKTGAKSVNDPLIFRIQKKSKKTGETTELFTGMRKCHVELAFVNEREAKKTGAQPGPSLRFCSAPGQTAKLVPLKSPEESVALARPYCACREKKSPVEKCVRKVTK